MVEDQPRKGGRQHQDHQPRQTGFPGGNGGGLQVGLVRWEHSRHLFEVLRGRLFDNIHCIVHGDNTDEPVFLVHHWHCEVVVLAHGLGHIFLVVQGHHGHHIGIHKVLNAVVLIRQKQIPHRQNTLQVSGGVGDIENIDGLQLTANAADALEGVRHGHVLLQTQVLHIHDGAGGILRVFQHFIDGFAHFGGGFIQNADDHTGGHLLHDVHGIVQIQFVQHFLQLGVGEAVDEHFLAVGFQLHEYLRRQFLGQQPIQQGHQFRTGLLQKLGDVRRLHGEEQVTHGGVLLILYQLPDIIQIAVHIFFVIEHLALLLSAKIKTTAGNPRYAAAVMDCAEWARTPSARLLTVTSFSIAGQ